ncbi:hypothetical protein HPB49_002653 [Dermacentor silvarum]|uniref:Uncharacterized protein n=1 Tax=Dermacentor silvarum TaxID=543639 RepID=A0ACB8C6Y2_DERSI|nr:hypothetical protein HPB49_002653 [Dermacentor silvarum]
MLGQTSAAVITFTGKTVPFFVRYYSGEVRCKPYRPTTHVCRICHQVGHRTDVCPTPEVYVCPQCGTQNPTQDHPSHPRCALCQGSHPTASKECPDRLKKTPLASQRTSRHEHSRSRSRSRPGQRRKRSGSRSCSCTRNQQGATRNPSGPAAPGSQTTGLFYTHMNVSEKFRKAVADGMMCVGRTDILDSPSTAIDDLATYSRWVALSFG